MKTIITDDFYKNVCAKFGERVREAREALNMTQKQFADDLGYRSQASVARWECGFCLPRARTLYHLARWMGVSLDWLYGFSEEKYHAQHRTRHRRTA